MLVLAIFGLLLATTFANETKQVKIILVGLPKAGTSSFHQFLNAVGIKSVHWKSRTAGIVADNILKAKNQSLPLLHYVWEDYDAVTEMARAGSEKFGVKCYFPQNTDLKQLYEENKDALFVLNSRNVDLHARSFNSFPYYGRFLQLHCPNFLPGNSSIPWIERYKIFISDHNDLVRAFFAARPESKFIEFKIEDSDVSVFQPFFDVKDEKFPHAFKNPRLNK